jgi:hypothetical protein
MVIRALNATIELATIIRINHAVGHQCLCFISAILLAGNVVARDYNTAADFQ